VDAIRCLLGALTKRRGITALHMSVPEQSSEPHALLVALLCSLPALQRLEITTAFDVGEEQAAQCLL